MCSERKREREREIMEKERKVLRKNLRIEVFVAYPYTSHTTFDNDKQCKVSWCYGLALTQVEGSNPANSHFF